MYKFKKNIFNLFSAFEAREDTFKDIKGKGILQRFHEMLGDYWDTELVPSLEGILGQTIVPRTMRSEFIPYMEQLYGIVPIVPDLEIRREFVAQWLSIMKVKGTLRSYQMVLGIFGITNVTIEDIPAGQGFDSPVTFDDPSRKFDASDCFTCSGYYLHYTPPVTSPWNKQEFIDIILRCVKLVEPINARLAGLVVNGVIVMFDLYIADNGDLIYVKSASIDSDFKVDDTGDLIVVGKSNYIIDNGDFKVL